MSPSVMYPQEQSKQEGHLEPLKPHYLDSSALVKLVVKEDRYDVLRKYFVRNTWFLTTWLCLGEALGVLKRKRSGKEEMPADKYTTRCFELLQYIDRTIHLDQLPIEQSDVFFQTDRIAQRYNLDISDALQVLTIKEGSLRQADGPSRSVLVTFDQGLARAAAAEGLRVWNVQTEDAPPP